MSFIYIDFGSIINPVISKEVQQRNLLKESNRFPLRRNDKLKEILAVLSLFVFFLSISFCGFSQNSKRIISLAPSITENIYLLNAQNKLVGCTNYCTQAIEDGIELVGSTVDVNIEKIFALQPDLVLTMQMTKNQDIEALRKIGVRVEVIPTPISFNEICEQTTKIGKLVGKETEANEIIRSTKEKVDELRKKSLQIPNENKIFFQIGANPVFTVLEKTFMNDFITFCKGTNIAGGLTKGTMTRESVLMKNPDVIIIATMGGFGEQEKKVWESYGGLKAVKNNKVFLIPSETSCSPTPVNFVKAFTDVVNFVNQ